MFRVRLLPNSRTPAGGGGGPRGGRARVGARGSRAREEGAQEGAAARQEGRRDGAARGGGRRAGRGRRRGARRGAPRARALRCRNRIARAERGRARRRRGDRCGASAAGRVRPRAAQARRPLWSRPGCCCQAPWPARPLRRFPASQTRMQWAGGRASAAGLREQTDRRASEEAAVRAADEALRERERQDAARRAAATLRPRGAPRQARCPSQIPSSHAAGLRSPGGGAAALAWACVCRRACMVRTSQPCWPPPCTQPERRARSRPPSRLPGSVRASMPVGGGALMRRPGGRAGSGGGRAAARARRAGRGGLAQRHRRHDRARGRGQQWRRAGHAGRPGRARQQRQQRLLRLAVRR